MTNPNIFRAYDIRGLYEKELDTTTAYMLGKAFADFIRRLYSIENPKIVIGKDNRTHGKILQDAVIKGLVEQGAHVSKMEDSVTPMMFFAVCKNGFDAGVSITASHNGPEYNGCKLVGRKAHSIAGEDIQELLRRIQEEDFESPSTGSLQEMSITKEYYKKITSIIQLQKKLKVVIDAGNGIAGKTYPNLFRQIGAKVIELYCQQDGSFPNHQPDPVVEENTADLKKSVIENKADLGISFDGDGDRCAIIDEKGVYHDANETLVILLRDILTRHPQTSVIHTVSTSLIVPKETLQHGGKPIMVAVGHTYVEQAMTEQKAFIGGEQSGHFFIKENYYPFDDAGYAGAKLLEIFSRSSKAVSELYQSVPTMYAKPELRIPVPDEKKFELVQQLSQQLSANYKCNTLDGVRVTFSDGSWLGIRASNTSPVLSVIMEGTSPEKLKEVEVLTKALLEKYGVGTNSHFYGAPK